MRESEETRHLTRDATPNRARTRGWHWPRRWFRGSEYGRGAGGRLGVLSRHLRNLVDGKRLPASAASGTIGYRSEGAAMRLRIGIVVLLSTLVVPSPVQHPPRRRTCR
ncbi:hypothetical protein GCM10023176_57030 [Micromonospora coerulea]|uniref:Uncharacterized protein n=1 Tax=Micromonospora coerulea TaxID=47856 RepID=A0ABP8T0Y7_9ACTN